MTTNGRDALATQLAGMHRLCLGCHGLGFHNLQECPDCHGTGKVFVFDDSVRVLCKNCGGTRRAWRKSLKHGGEELDVCQPCGGRGWMASLDRRVWEPALANAGYVVHVIWHPASKMPTIHVTSWEENRGTTFKDGECLLTALAQKEQA